MSDATDNQVDAAPEPQAGDAEAEAGALRAVLERAAERWHSRGEVVADLWEGAALEQLARAGVLGEDGHSELLTRFIEASRRCAVDQQRQRKVAMVGVCVLAGAALVGSMVFGGGRTANKARRRPAKGSLLAGATDLGAGATPRQRAARLARRARRAAAAGASDRARALLRAAFEAGDNAEARALWWRLRPPRTLARWPLRRAPTALAVAADGRHLALVGQRSTAVFALGRRAGRRVARSFRAALPGARAFAFFGGAGRPVGAVLVDAGGALKLWSRLRGPPRALGRASGKALLAAAPDGGVLALAEGRVLRLFAGAPATTKPAAKRELGAAITALAVGQSGEGQVVLVGTADGAVWSVDPSQPAAPPRPLGLHGKAVTAVSIDAAGRRLASADSGGELRLMRAPTSRSAAVPGLPRAGAATRARVIATRRLGVSLTALRFVPGGELLVVGGGRAARLSGELRARASIAAPGNLAATLDDGRWVRLRGRAVEVLAARVTSELDDVHAHRGGARDVAQSADGSVIATLGKDAVVRLWSRRGRRIGALHLDGALAAICILGDRIVVGDGGGSVRVMSLRGVLVAAARLHRGAVSALVCRPGPSGGGAVISGGADGRVVRWSPAAGGAAAQRTLYRHSGAVRALAVHEAAAPTLASVGVDGVIRQQALGAAPAAGKAPAAAAKAPAKPPTTPSSAATIRPIRAEGPLTDVAFSPDGRWLAAAGPHGLWVISRRDGAARRLAGASGARVVFLPDTIGAQGGTLLLVDAAGRRHRIDPSSSKTPPPPASARSAWRLARLRRGRKQLVAAALDGTLRRFDFSLRELARDDRPPAPSGAAPARQVQGTFRDKPVSVALAGDVVLVTLRRARTSVRRPGQRSRVVGRFEVGPGARTIALLAGGVLAAGMEDGRVELRQIGYPRARLALRPPGSHASQDGAGVSRLWRGPRGTLLVAHDDGELSLWLAARRRRLWRGRLHGAAVARSSDAKSPRWTLTSTLGDSLTLDLTPFALSRCALLIRVWGQAPYVVREGRLQRRAPPSRHVCNGTGGGSNVGGK